VKDTRTRDHRNHSLPDDAHLDGPVDRDLTAAELARVEAHLAECDDCAREMRATVSLLRGLPDPEPPARLAADVMRRIAAGEGRRPRFVELLRIAGEPRFAAAVAATVAGLVLFTSMEFGTGSLVNSTSDPSRERLAVSGDPAGATDARATGARRPPPLSRAAVARGTPPQQRPLPAIVAFERLAPPQRPAAQDPSQRFGFFGGASAEVPLRDLDGELDALMANPGAFIDRVGRTAEEARRPMIAPLVERSTHRGDVAAVARQLGAARPLAVPVTAR
jgi:hypothetical protein